LTFVRAFLIVGLCTVGAVAHAAPCRTTPAPAEPTPDALAANDLAIKMSEEQRYVEALALFQKAYDLSPSYVILFNIAKMAALTGDPARAIRAYQCHVVEGGAEVSPERRAEVEAEVARLKLDVGTLRVDADVDAATVELDGSIVGQTPLEAPVVANPGTRRLTVRANRAVTKEVEVLKGQTLDISFRLRDEVSETPSGQTFRFPGAVVGTAWVVTGLVTVSAAVTGALAVAGQGDIDDDTYLGPNRRPPAGSPLDDKVQRTRALATATDALIAIGCVAGAAAISFSVVNAVAGDEEVTAPKRAAMWVGAGPLGLSLGGEIP
jgi:hypothetical protein